MLTKDRNFYRQFFQLYPTLVLNNIIILSVNLADNIMIGSYSQTALSGVASVNQLQFLFLQLVMGAGEAVVAMSSQYWGQNRTQPIKRILSVALWLGAALGILLFLLGTWFPAGIMNLFTDSQPIIDQGVSYLRIIRFTYPIFALTNIFLAGLRSVETVKIGFYVSLMSLLVNCSINYTLINGHFGAPAMGVRGAAIGTLVARSLELLIVLFYVFFVDKKLKMRPRELFCCERTLASDYGKNSWRFLLVSGMFGVSTALQTVILGHMDIGGSAIAANSVATTLYQVLKVITIGAASSAAIIIGKNVGQGNLPKLKEYTRTLQVIFLGLGIITSVLLFLLRTPVLSLYQLNDATKVMANQFLLVLCVTCIGTSYQMPVITGIIRGGGDSTFVVLNDLISIWGIVLPVSFLAAFVWGWSPVAVIFCLNADQIFKCGAAAVKVNRYHWMKRLTRDNV